VFQYLGVPVFHRDAGGVMRRRTRSGLVLGFYVFSYGVLFPAGRAFRAHAAILTGKVSKFCGGKRWKFNGWESWDQNLIFLALPGFTRLDWAGRVSRGRHGRGALERWSVERSTRADFGLGGNGKCLNFRVFSKFDMYLRHPALRTHRSLLTVKVSKFFNRSQWNIFSGRELRGIDSVKAPSKTT